MVMGRTTSRPEPVVLDHAPNTLPDFLDWVDELAYRQADLHPLTVKLAKEKFELQAKNDDVRHLCRQLRDKLQVITSPKQFPAVVTNVRRDEEGQAEVYCGGTRIKVTVNPELESTAIQVGTQGLLSRDRNCLIAVDGQPPWKDVGTFEGYTDQGRKLLVRHQDRLIAVTPSAELSSESLKHGDMIGFDSDGSRLAFTRIERPADEDLFHDETPQDRFEELGGLDREIALLKRLVQFRLQNPEIAQRYRLPAKHGVLLEGPPGNGKTKLARCLARFVAESIDSQECRFMAISGSSDYSKWLGQSEQKIRDRFAAAREIAGDGTPVVMFFDEIDAIGRRRGADIGSSTADRILATLLAELDGISQISNLIVIGATNRADVLDNGLIRPGRLGDIKICIPPPDRAAARMILSSYLRDLPLNDESDTAIESLLSRIFSPNGHHANVARVTLRDGRQMAVKGRALISGALLENVVKVAAEEAAVREFETGKQGICEEDLATALDRELSGVARLLTAANVRNYVPHLPQDNDPVAVEVDPVAATSSSQFVINAG